MAGFWVWMLSDKMGLVVYMGTMLALVGLFMPYAKGNYGVHQGTHKDYFWKHFTKLHIPTSISLFFDDIIELTMKYMV